MQKMNRLVGRDDVIVLIRAFMDRPLVDGGRRRSQQRPVLVLEGARGSGKSSLLTVMSSLLDQNVPFAGLDFEAEKSAGLPDVLSALAFQLSRSCPVYGAISFPRLTIARLVMTVQLNLDSHPAAGRQVVDVLQQERRIDAVREILEDSAGVFAAVATHQFGIPHDVGDQLQIVTKKGVRAAGDIVSHWRPSRRIVLGAFHEWFGHRGRDLTNDPIDVLVDLNRFSQIPSNENRQWIHELLWEAFLTDLRDHFESSRHSDELSLNCVVLVDNADTRVGREFVAGLIQARADQPGRPDPLTAVVTSRGDLLANVPAGDLIEYPPGGPPQELARRSTARFRLRDLSVADTRSMVVALGMRGGNTSRSVEMVHRFTDGHPASTRLLISTLGQHPEHRAGLTGLLDQTRSGLEPGRGRVGDGMLKHLLTNLPRTAREDLVTCSSAMTLQHTRGIIELLAGGESSYQQITPVLWPTAGGAGPKVLRRLLLRLLAERRPESCGEPEWETVFRQHRLARRAADDTSGELYYALAEGDLGFVVGRLSQELATTPCHRWHKLLLRTSQAPHRRPKPVLSPQGEMLALLRQHPHTGHPEIARLVLATWIVGDPLTDSSRSGLYLQMAADCDSIARICGQDDVEPLLRAAIDYQREAELWD